MISKLPGWVWLGGAVLAFSAGMINAIAFLGFTHEAATHVTGLFSQMSIAAVRGSADSLKLFLAISSFFAGAVMCGIILRDAHLKMGRHYELALNVECLLLVLSAFGFSRNLLWGEYFAAMAAGLQNGMASTYSGAIVRTTHLTGILTDLGVLVGHAFRGMPIELKKMRLLSVILVSFTLGGVIGTFAFAQWHGLAMLVPAAIIGTGSVVYNRLKHRDIKKF